MYMLSLPREDEHLWLSSLLPHVNSVPLLDDEGVTKSDTVTLGLVCWLQVAGAVVVLNAGVNIRGGIDDNIVEGIYDGGIPVPAPLSLSTGGIHILYPVMKVVREVGGVVVVLSVAAACS